MPRTPDGTYRYPDGTPGNTGQTIFSARYNTFLDDLALTLNSPLPVNMGGTGAGTVPEARAAMKAEVTPAGQVVTNFDVHTFESGSFVANPGALNSPDGAGAATNTYIGTAQVVDPALTVVVQARNLVTGVGYERRKTSGTWGVWLLDSGAGAFVARSGDTMSGDLKIDKVNPLLTLNKTGAGQICAILGTGAAANRWSIQMPNGDAESTGNAGSNFVINRFADNGALLPPAFQITRSSGTVSLIGPLSIQSGLVNCFGYT